MFGRGRRPTTSSTGRHLDAYADAVASWLPREAEIIDTTGRTPAEVAEHIAHAVSDRPEG